METIGEHQIKHGGLGEVISDSTLRRMASERRLPLDLVEKDYLMGWALIGVSKSSLRDMLIFKGGTSLSKIYYPLDWRISEDLDFTPLQDTNMEEISKSLSDELPQLVDEASQGIRLTFNKPFLRKDFLRATVALDGPITRHRTKIEVTREKTIGPYKTMKIAQTHDYVDSSIQTYTMENILAEKIRSLIERTKIRDYYDTWRLMKQNTINTKYTRTLFIEKCKGKNIKYKGITQFFPENILEQLQPYYEKDLTRLTPEPLPPLNTLLTELRTSLETLFSKDACLEQQSAND
jgi:predicted nucleotidyltransferase component of viral defense system